MGGPGRSLSFEESGTWAGRQRFQDLGCCTLGKRREDMGASVLGSYKEGGDDLFSLRKTQRDRLGWVTRSRANSLSVGLWPALTASQSPFIK